MKTKQQHFLRGAFLVIIIMLSMTGNGNAQNNKPMDPMDPETWTLNFGFGPGIK